MFYSAFVESVLTFDITGWFGSATEAHKNSLREIVTTAGNNRSRSFNKAEEILSDPRHPLITAFELLPSGRGYRYPAFSKNRTKGSFILQVIKSLNKPLDDNILAFIFYFFLLCLSPVGLVGDIIMLWVKLEGILLYFILIMKHPRRRNAVCEKRVYLNDLNLVLTVINCALIIH